MARGRGWELKRSWKRRGGAREKSLRKERRDRVVRSQMAEVRKGEKKLERD